MSSSSPTSTTATSDPQSWVYPPPGAPTPPITATSNFGPVYLGDTIQLDWYPSTVIEVDLTCFASNGNASAGDIILSGVPPPSAYTFSSETLEYQAAVNYCHFFFRPSVMGNTVVWQFLNEAPVGRSTTTFSAPAITSSSSSSSSASSSSSSSSSSSVSASSSTPNSAASQTPSSDHGKSNAGTEAGIGVGVGLGVALLAAAIALLFRWRRKGAAPIALAVPAQYPAELQAGPPPELSAGEKYGGSWPRHELVGSTPP